MGVWTKKGSADLGNIYFKNLMQHPELYLGIFTNDYAGNLNTVTLTELIEPTASDYARLALNPVNWLIGDDVATYPVVDFEVSLEAFGNIYGCFICTVASGSSGDILAAHKFATAVDLNFYGDRLEITPIITIT